MQITHEEARRLIHINANQILDLGDKKTLEAHITDCVECYGYADEIKDIEKTLRSTMQKHWSARFLPLQAREVADKVSSRNRTNVFGNMRVALIGSIATVFAFTIWQFTSTNNVMPHPTLIGISPIPTPSVLTTNAQTVFENCTAVQYHVREGDTLTSLARQFSIAEDAIIKANDLQSKILVPTALLLIPICDPTPTSTLHPPLLTTTPALQPTTYTPG